MPMHPREHKDHRFHAQVLAVIGAVVVAVSAGNLRHDTEGMALAGCVLGCFLLACSAIHFDVHAFATMMHGHELWRRGLDQDVVEE
jgi:hypothetical protein